MKKNLLAFVFLFASSTSALAQTKGAMGLGVVVGAPTAITGKLWLDNTKAVQAGLGFDDRFTVYGDFLWHAWDVLPAPPQGKLPVYLGLGAQLRAYHDAELGIRAVAGVAYWLPRHPVEIFLELVPVFYLTRDPGVGFDAGLGIRYYFKS